MSGTWTIWLCDLKGGVCVWGGVPGGMSVPRVSHPSSECDIIQLPNIRDFENNNDDRGLGKYNMEKLPLLWWHNKTIAQKIKNP